LGSLRAHEPRARREHGEHSRPSRRNRQQARATLETLDDIYGFAVEQVAIARGQLMELTIVLILVFELVLFFAGIM